MRLISNLSPKTLGMMDVSSTLGVSLVAPSLIFARVRETQGAWLWTGRAEVDPKLVEGDAFNRSD